MQLTSANMVPTHMPLMFQLLFQLSYEQCKEKKNVNRTSNQFVESENQHIEKILVVI